VGELELDKGRLEVALRSLGELRSRRQLSLLPCASAT
jgi:hypothetical protein